ncbi:MAG: hypothetical protein NW223_23670 [Hyphomicrobiaceae bacterium]|nr:hypothetical protein [Hyphomicrobiaceae bacterium]
MQTASPSRYRRHRTRCPARPTLRFGAAHLPPLPSKEDWLAHLFHAQIAHAAVTLTKAALRDKARGLLAQGETFEVMVEQLERTHDHLAAIAEIVATARARLLVVAGEILDADATEAPA